HDYAAQSISYFPDGKQMICAAWGDKTTRRYDLRAGEEIEHMRDVCEWAVYAVAVSRDGRWVITAGEELKACEVETGMVKTFQGHPRGISCIDISKDSMLLASGSNDSTVRIWSLDTGRLVAAPFEGHTEVIGGLAVSFGGALLASTSFDNTIKLWAFESRQLLASFQGLSANTLALSPDSNQL
ncbi:WD40 repeat-like protein, partial [Rhizopogon salebrosus TDB-379]